LGETRKNRFLFKGRMKTTIDEIWILFCHLCPAFTYFPNLIILMIYNKKKNSAEERERDE
jgi:hypothetical protein